MRKPLTSIEAIKGKTVIEVFDLFDSKMIICEDSYLHIGIDHGYYYDSPIISIKKVDDLLSLNELQKLSPYDLQGVSEKIALILKQEKELKERQQQIRRKQYEELKKEFENGK